MRLTSELIHRAAKSGCGWTKKQLAILGIEYPLKRGWIKSLIGKEISKETYAEFCSLRSNLFYPQSEIPPASYHFFDAPHERDQSALDFANALYESCGGNLE